MEGEEEPQVDQGGIIDLDLEEDKNESAAQVDEISFKGKLLDAIESTFEKSSKSRQVALEFVRKAFTSRYMQEFCFSRKTTLIDMIDRILKKGKSEEQATAASLAAILCMTLGIESDALFKDTKNILYVMAKDESVPSHVRSEFVSALGLLAFITRDVQTKSGSILDLFFGIFSGSLLKGNGVLRTVTPLTASLHASALSAWTLLVTIQPDHYVVSLTEQPFIRIVELLDVSSVDLKIAAGEALAVINEMVKALYGRFKFDDQEEICEKLHILANDRQKFRAKNDGNKRWTRHRIVQRSSFRDILRGIEKGEAPSILVKFGKERLELNSWLTKRRYDAFCHVLASGMNRHLTENDLLRDIFSLGPQRIVENDRETIKAERVKRQKDNSIASKTKTKDLRELRDKRADVVDMTKNEIVSSYYYYSQFDN